jgi:enterochelin esterase family protein
VQESQDSNFQQFINRVNSAPSQDRSAIVDSFMLAVPAFPFIEDPVVHFIYRGNVTSVNVPGDANSWSSSGYPMTKLSTTDFWYTSQVFESDARLDYKFILNGSSWILDPRNPHTVSGGFGPNSELAMPQYVQPWEIQYDSTVPHGRIESRTIFSNYRSATYSLNIYLPPDYRSVGQPYPVVYFQDGSEYINLGKTKNVIDNLIGYFYIQDIIAVFVTPLNRNEEYAGSLRNQYMQFFVYELVPFIDTIYNTYKARHARAVIGDSYGGNISALISYNHPGIFGNCGLHSGAFQSNNYEAFNLIVNGVNKKDSIRYFSVWGTYENPLTQNMRAFKDSLLKKGYVFVWEERHEGHSWGLWRATTDLILRHFFGYPSGVSEINNLPVEIKLDQNYPNPFNPTTNFQFSIANSQLTILKVYDLLGREVETLVNEVLNPGTYTVKWDASKYSSGMYLYRLQTGSYSVTKKLVMVR